MGGRRARERGEMSSGVGSTEELVASCDERVK